MKYLHVTVVIIAIIVVISLESLFFFLFIQPILHVGQINLPVLTSAAFHNGGFVILTMTAVITLMSKDVRQVGMLGYKLLCTCSPFLTRQRHLFYMTLIVFNSPDRG